MPRLIGPATRPQLRPPAARAKIIHATSSKSAAGYYGARGFFVHGGQAGGNLPRNFQGELYFKRSGAPDELVESFPLHKLHCVKVILSLPA
jgi:hypothetical protein